MESELQSANQPAEGNQDASEPAKPRSQPNRLRRAIIGAAVGAASIGLAQWFGPSTDHQVANMISLGAGLLATLYVLYQLHRQAAADNRRWMVPALSLVSLVALAGLVRLKGFSGEMLPQFEFRFAASPPEIRSLEDETSPGVVADSASESGSAAADSLGFLGTDRTGVLSPRLFSVPSDADQVETLWSQGSGEGWSSFAVSGDRAVTLEQREELECVTCYRLSDGQLLWIVSHKALHQHPLGGIGPRSTPTIVGPNVYAQGATGRLWCLDLASGETNWTVDLLDLAGWDQVESEAAISWGRAGSPLIVDGLCIVPYGGPEANEVTGRSLVALDAQNGTVRWASGEDQISYASPGILTLGGRRQIVSVNEKTISGHNIADGKVLWDFEWPGQSNGGANCAMVVSAGEDSFLVGKGYGGGSALVEVKARKDGTLFADGVWDSMRVLKTKFTHACVDGPVAYAISNGSLEAVEIAAGDPLWRQSRRQRLGQGQILLVEDTIVAQSEGGDVVFVAVDPGEYRELIRLPALDSKTWNIPTIAGRHLLVRNDRQAICFLLPNRVD